MVRFPKIIIFCLLFPLIGEASLRPYSEYKNLSKSEKIADLKLRFSLNLWGNFGGSKAKEAKNVRSVISSLRDGADRKETLFLDLLEIFILIDERQSDKADIFLNKIKKDILSENDRFLSSRFHLLKGEVYYFDNKMDLAIESYQKGLSEYENDSHNIEKYYLLYVLASAESEMGNNDRAIEVSMENLRIIGGKYKKNEAIITYHLGSYYMFKGDHAIALDNLFKAIKFFQKINDDKNIVKTLNQIAIVKEALGKYSEQITYYKNAEKHFTKDVSPHLKVIVLSNIFDAYLSKQKDYDNAELYYKKALKIAEDNNLISHEIFLKTGFANLKVEKGYPKTAIDILDSLKNIKEEFWINFRKHKYNQAYSRAYLKMNELKKAEEYFSKSELFLKDVGRSDFAILHYKDGVELYRNLENVQKEYEYYRKWRELKEKVDKEQSKKLLYARENESLALNNQLYAQENKNLALKNQQAKLILENQKTRLFMMSGFVLAILVIVALQFNRNKIIKRKNLALEAKEKVIREKTNDLQAILDNIVQGVVSIELVDERTRLLKDVSRHFYHIFSDLSPSAFENKDPIGVLFEGSSLSAEDRSKINSVIVSSTGETIWQWEINQSNLPMEMTILDGSKIIEIDWVVVLDQELISKLIITFKDVTEIRGLGEKQKQNEINVQKLISLSLMDQKEYFILMSSVEKLINESIEVVSQNSEFLKESIDLVFRNLHTIKGLARTYDLMLLSAFAHQIEDYFQEVRSGNTGYDQSGCLAQLDEMKHEIETYRTLAKTKLKWDQELSTVPLSVKVLTKWYQEISGVNEGHKLDVLLKEIKNKYSTSLEDALQNIIMSSKKLSKELNKGEVKFSLDGCDIFVTEKIEGHLSSIFVHLIRNSIDHGFEENSERERRKLDPPEIKIQVESGEDDHVIYLSDNGKGINLETLRRKAKDNDLTVDTKNDLDVASLIFESGISTKEKVSNISGRGVGMDAVRKYLEGLGGHIDLVANGESNGAYLPVKFKITVPQVFFEA